jgi:hypothetical protein
MSARRPKKLVAWRLTEECIALIQGMADRRGVSQAAIVEMLVRDEAEREEEERQLKLAA